VAVYVLWVLGIVFLALSIWAIADVAATPAQAFQHVGSSRKRWLMLLVFFTLCLDVIGAPLAAVYFAFVRPKVRAQRAS
jgi:hypothetical protein